MLATKKLEKVLLHLGLSTMAHFKEQQVGPELICIKRAFSSTPFHFKSSLCITCQTSESNRKAIVQSNPVIGLQSSKQNQNQHQKQE